MRIAGSQGIKGKRRPVEYIFPFLPGRLIRFLFAASGQALCIPYGIQSQLKGMKHPGGHKKQSVAIHPHLHGIAPKLRHGKKQKSKKPCGQKPKMPAHLPCSIEKAQEKGQYRSQLGRCHQSERPCRLPGAGHKCRPPPVCPQPPEKYKKQFYNDIIQRRMHIPGGNRNKFTKGLACQSHGEQFVIPDVVAKAQKYGYRQKAGR